MNMRNLFKPKPKVEPKQTKEELMLGESLATIFLAQVDSTATREEKEKEVEAYLAKNTGHDELEYATKYLHAETEKVEKDILSKINLAEASAITHAHKTLTKDAKNNLTNELHNTSTESKKTAQYVLNAFCLTHPGDKETRVKCMEAANHLDSAYQQRAKHIKAQENIIQHQKTAKLKTASASAPALSAAAIVETPAAVTPAPTNTSPAPSKK